MERDLTVRVLSMSFDNFNSHAHVERDYMNGFNVNMSKISTHTLTWSVTSGISQRTFCIAISTHTLTWSVTGGAKEHTLFEKFQLTRSRGA